VRYRAPTRDDVRLMNRQIVSFHLPRSKTTKVLPCDTHTLFIAPLRNSSGMPAATCPVDTLDNHIRVNAPQGDTKFLYTYTKEPECVSRSPRRSSSSS
jgi:hypothetical protein